MTLLKSSSSSSSSTKTMVLKSLSIVALLSFCGVTTTTGVLAISQVRGEQQRNQRKQSGSGNGPSAAATTASAASVSDFDEIIHRAEASLRQEMTMGVTTGGGRRRLSLEESPSSVATRDDGKGKGKDNGKGKGKNAIEPPIDEECGLFEVRCQPAYTLSTWNCNDLKHRSSYTFDLTHYTFPLSFNVMSLSLSLSFSLSLVPSPTPVNSTSF